MFDQVQASLNPPRLLTTDRRLLSRLGAGLRGYQFFGCFFTLGGLLLTGLAVAFGAVLFAFLALAMVIFIGGFFLKKAFSDKKRRLRCLTHGKAVMGKVISQGRAFNPFSSRGFYTLQIQSDFPVVCYTVKHTSEALWETFPAGSAVLGFELEGELIWGPEIGVNFELAPPPLA